VSTRHSVKKRLPVGIDNFREIREDDKYYVDKSLLIQRFIQQNDKVALITRPRRFGKTLNMTMLREFFDITSDSTDIFDGLAIMDTEYSKLINSRPVVYFTFKDCKANTVESLRIKINSIILTEYAKYYRIFKGAVDESETYFYRFFMVYDKLLNNDADISVLEMSVELLERVLYEYYRIKPIVLIDEYDQPIISSYEYGYHDQLKAFFSGFYGAALKGQDCLHQAMLTGIQRVVKESIFSQLNNVRVYTVIDEQYSDYFGLHENETRELLAYYGLPLDEPVKQKYNGYLFYKTEMYNPWSVLNYADIGRLDNYWINTSTNYLVRQSISEANDYFHRDFDKLIADDIAEVSPDLGCSFIELKHNDTLWGLLVNAGYVTVLEQLDELFMKVRIPNGEVRSEFLRIVADRANVQSRDLQKMFKYLLQKNLDGFLDIYRELVISCTSYFDAKENAYHMLFLGMCVSLNNIYKITSNIESGYGRSDIRMESLSKERPHIVIEFKQGDEPDKLRQEALKQILDKKYYTGLTGEILCVGIAHNKKICSLAYKILDSH
jgi:hypothetical protein